MTNGESHELSNKWSVEATKCKAVDAILRRPSVMESMNVDRLFGRWCILCHVEGVPCGDMCQMNSGHFLTQHVHFRVTHGAHTMGPCHHGWYQHAMSFLGLQPQGMSNITISESVEGWSSKFTQTINRRFLRDFSQLLDQAVEGGCKYFGLYKSEGVEKLESCNISESYSGEFLTMLDQELVGSFLVVWSRSGST
jgi:hypothetical protein